MVDFHSFETFDPNGPGLGNLFGQVSPFEALGIWPSGDFRLAPGDGAVPAVGYYLGAAFALVLLALRPRCAAGAAARPRSSPASAPPRSPTRAARIGGTPYTAAKAIEIAAPLVALAILLPLLGRAPGRFVSGMRQKAPAPVALGCCRGLRCRRRRLLAARPRQRPGRADLLLAGADRAAAAGRRRTRPSSSPRRSCSTTNTASRYLAWELRGGRVCIADRERQPASAAARGRAS